MSEHGGETLGHTEAELLTLKSKPASSLGILVGGLALTAACIWTVSSEDGVFWDVFGVAFSVFFGVGCVLIGYSVVRPPELQLNESGFSWRAGFRTASCRWTDVERFYVTSLGFETLRVGWNYSPTYERHSAGRRVAAALSGTEAALPENYGREPAELAVLLNERLDRHTTQQRP